MGTQFKYDAYLDCGALGELPIEVWADYYQGFPGTLKEPPEEPTVSLDKMLLNIGGAKVDVLDLLSYDEVQDWEVFSWNYLNEGLD